MQTTQENLLKNLKEQLISSAGKQKIKNYNELNQIVDRVLISPDNQEKLLQAIILNYDIDAESAVKIFGRWYEEGKPLIKDFATYALHCLKVDTLFLFGLTSDLITTRPTNRVDCEYLYYLPFCNVFTSNDKIHKNLIPLLIRNDQHFITGEELKKDLSIIDNYFNQHGIEERQKYNNEPPIIDDSFTFKLWKQYFNYPKQSNLQRKLSPEEFEMMKRKMDEFERAMNGEPISTQQGEETEFIIKTSYLSADDPCFCGSGKKVIECCIPPEKFKELANKSR